jgi:hypothetical protein
VLTQDCQVGSISSFSVAHDGTLTLVQKVASGGLFPNSLTVDGDGGGVNSSCTNFTGPDISGFGGPMQKAILRNTMRDR